MVAAKVTSLNRIGGLQERRNAVFLMSAVLLLCQKSMIQGNPQCVLKMCLALEFDTVTFAKSGDKMLPHCYQHIQITTYYS